jgi:hypothetical protein
MQAETQFGPSEVQVSNWFCDSSTAQSIYPAIASVLHTMLLQVGLMFNS